AGTTVPAVRQRFHSAHCLKLWSHFCPKSPGQRFPGQVAGGMKLMQQRGGLVNVAEIRTQAPLPETADELCAVARTLGAPDSDVLLGARATEREVKRLSDTGKLSAYRIVH